MGLTMPIVLCPAVMVVEAVAAVKHNSLRLVR
jgi:hypothetical protein